MGPGVQALVGQGLAALHDLRGPPGFAGRWSGACGSALPIPLVFSMLVAWLAAGAFASPALARTVLKPSPTPPNVDISVRHLNESEEAIAINPTNPDNVVELSNVDLPLVGMWLGVSF